jgi:hypothetical protein
MVRPTFVRFFDYFVIGEKKRSVFGLISNISLPFITMSSDDSICMDMSVSKRKVQA